MSQHTAPRLSAVFLALALAGCSPARKPAEVAPVPASAPTRMTPLISAEAAPQLLVRRAALGVDVDDVAASASRAHGIAIGSGGYVEREERAERSASVTIRVPEPRLDAALDTLGRLGKITNRTVSAQDVTEEAIDVEARIRSLTASRDRLRELLTRASAVGDVVAVEKELARVQGELDSLQGRLQHLRSTTALAELHVSFHQKVVLGPLGRFFSAIGRGLGKLFVVR
jgi:hypothetical protein